MQTRYEIVANLINSNHYKSIAEIGVMNGMTSLYLLNNCDLEKVILVDKSFASLNNTLNSINFPQLELIEKLSVDAAQLIPDRSLDLVFIDADHGYINVVKDINAWLPKIKKGGCICGHDYGDRNECTEVKKAVDEIFPTADFIKDSIDDVIYIWYIYIKS